MLNGLRMNSPVNEKSNRRRIPWRSVLAVVLCGFLIWFVHPALLSHGLRFALVQAASGAGLRLEIGNIHARLAEPIILEAVRSAPETRRVPCRRGCRSCRNLSELALARPFRDGRLFRALVVEDLRAVVDLRPKRRRKAGRSRVCLPLSRVARQTGRCDGFRIHVGDPARQSEFVALNQSILF